MKIFLSLLLLVFNIASAQTFITKQAGEADQSTVIQNAFNDPNIYTVLINTSTTINGIVNIPEGKVLKFEAGGRLMGKGTLNGGIIDALYHVHIFDTSININPAGVNQYFSVKWFGASGKNDDAYAAIQKSINTCIKNNIRTVYIPLGRYHISQPLIIRAADTHGDDKRNFCTLEVVGQSSFWDSNLGTEIIADFNNTFAIGIQNGKGCKLRKLTILGKFQPPKLAKFYSASFEDFTDKNVRDSRYSPYAGIVINPFTNIAGDAFPKDGGYPGLSSYYGKANALTTQSGSTATEMEEISIKGFVVGICSSPNGLTRNAEITIINKIQFENCKLAISGGQDQEKGNTISNIHCWGGTHTIFATGLYGNERQAGNWIIDHVGIAGGVVRFIYNEQHGYFPTHISHVYAESIGTWGTINSELACEISDCHIDFVYPEDAGNLTLITSWGENIVYRSCNFRYYGRDDAMKIEGNAVYDHCYFSGPVNQKILGARPIMSAARSHLKLLLVLLVLFAIALLTIAFIYFRRKRLKRRLIQKRNAV
jgi:hypothetical protein